MGSVIPILGRSNKFTCAVCGKKSQSGISRLDGGRRVGYLCPICAENSGCNVVLPLQPGDLLLPVSLRINAWPVLALCLTALGTLAVMFLISGLAWITLGKINLLLSPHV
jgi:hypothetical protein